MTRFTLQSIALGASAIAVLALIILRIPGAGEALVLIGGFTAAVTGVLYRSYQTPQAEEPASRIGYMGRGSIGGPGDPGTLVAVTLILQAGVIILTLTMQPGDSRIWVLLPLFAVHDAVIAAAWRRGKAKSRDMGRKER